MYRYHWQPNSSRARCYHHHQGINNMLHFKSPDCHELRVRRAGLDPECRQDHYINKRTEREKSQHKLTCLKEETTQPTTRRTSVADQPSLVAAKKHLHCSRNCQNDCVFPFCSAESQTLESRENCKWTSNRLYNVLWLTAQ